MIINLRCVCIKIGSKYTRAHLPDVPHVRIELLENEGIHIVLMLIPLGSGVHSVLCVYWGVLQQNIINVGRSHTDRPEELGKVQLPTYVDLFRIEENSILFAS